MGLETQPLHQGRKHGYRSTHTRRYTGSLRPQEGPVPEVRQTRPSQADVHAHGPHRRLQGRRLPGDHLRRVRRPVRLLHDLPQLPRGRAPQGPLRQQGPRPRARPHPQGRHERRADLGVAPPRVSSSTSPRGSSTTCSTTTPGNSTWPSTAARSWSTSAARSASTNCTWAGSRCSWPPTRSPTCPWPSPWSTRTTRTTCGGSSGTSRTGA